MARLKGTSRSDLIQGFDQDDFITAGRGGDDIDGGGGNDFLRGDAGNDFIGGGNGSDELRGGLGDDYMFDLVLPSSAGTEYSFDQIWGGQGNDTLLGGVGGDLLVGGSGHDLIEMMGGAAYGDEGPGLAARYAGADVIITDLAVDYGSDRQMTGGLGADTFQITLSPWDEATHVDVLDFESGEDALVLGLRVPWEGTDRIAHAQEVFGFMDGAGNANGRIDAGDLGATTAENSLTIAFGNDSVTLHGATDYVF